MPLKRPTLIPTLARARIAVGSLPDPDWAGTQAVPADELLGDMAGVTTLAVFMIPREADGTTVSSGNIDVQLVAVSGALVYGTPVDTGATTGLLLTYDVLASQSVAIRVAAEALAGAAAYVELWWFAQRLT